MFSTTILILVRLLRNWPMLIQSKLLWLCKMFLRQARQVQTQAQAQAQAQAPPQALCPICQAIRALPEKLGVMIIAPVVQVKSLSSVMVA
jgi:hypothetical protein